LNAYIYSSQGIGVGYDELEDADFDIATAIGTVLGERLWRAIATAAMTGSGSSQPQGLSLAAGKGLLMGNCTINYARMIQFNKTLDWAYLSGPKERVYVPPVAVLGCDEPCINHWSTTVAAFNGRRCAWNIHGTSLLGCQ